jgi:hypothetical protein
MSEQLELPLDHGPKTVKVRAIDILPFHHGVLMLVDGHGAAPATIDYVSKRWADDGSRTVYLMLDIHMFDIVDADHLLDVVELKPSTYHTVDKALAQQAKFLNMDPKFVMKGWHL